MKKIILDTDLCFDCDDALAVAMANIAHKKGWIEVLAMTHCLADEDCADAISWINEYYGNEKIPVGVSKSCKIDCQEEKGYFIRSIQAKGQREVSYPSSTDVILQKLSENQGCTLVFIGQMNNLAYLVERKNDLYQGRRIGEILENSVDSIVIMGGNFLDEEGEFNIVKDIEAAKRVTEQADLPLVFVDFHQGKDVYTGEEVQKAPANPVAQIYQEFSKLSGEALRPSWDPIAFYFAAFREKDFYALSSQGRVEVLHSGRTLFHEGKGKHRLLTVKNKAAMSKAIEAVFEDYKF